MIFTNKKIMPMHPFPPTRMPGKKDKWWITVFSWLSLCFFITIAGLSHFLLDMHVSMADAVLWIAMAIAASAAVCGFFYAGLRIAATMSLLGALSGIGCVGYVFMQPVQLRGIVGLVSGMQLAFIFFLVGINAQMIAYIISKKARKQQ